MPDSKKVIACPARLSVDGRKTAAHATRSNEKINKFARRRRGAEIPTALFLFVLRVFAPRREMPASTYFAGSAPFGTAKTRGRRSATGGSAGNFACGSV